MSKKLFLLAVAVLVSCTLHATKRDRLQAVQQAREFMSKNFSMSSAARRAAQTITLHDVETGQSLVYAFNIEGGGFVVVAGDDCAPAVLGFSETSVINPSDMPDGMRALFEQYQQEMQFMINNGHRATDFETLGEEIKPMLTCKWGQGAPYNYMCPKYYVRNRITGQTENKFSLTGCPATAMAQVLYYHKFPKEITKLPGKYYNNKLKCDVPFFDVSKTLEWDKMLDSYGTRNIVTGPQEKQDAVAKLMRLVGQSVTMRYSPSISGMKDYALLYSFINYFNYDASTIKRIQRNEYSYNDWVKMIYQEMVNKRPVVYTGFSNTGGHTYVVDGYKKNDFFYINWGWYGNSDSEDAFRLALCNPGKKYEGGGTGDAGYSGDQSALIGIQPASTPQHSEYTLGSFIKWCGSYTYERASADQDFDLTEAISQWIETSIDIEGFKYGAIVKDAEGEVVQEVTLKNTDGELWNMKAGEQTDLYRRPLKVGANLGDGTYTMEFVYRMRDENGEWEKWKSFYPVYKIMFKISKNTLTFDCRPEWLTVKKEVQEVTSGEEIRRYNVKVTLENHSTDKTFQRTVRLGRDNRWKSRESYGFSVMLEPGETKEVTMDYNSKTYVPVVLHLTTTEDGVPLGEGVATGAEYKTEGVTFDGKCNLDEAIKKNDDNTYTLRADDSYQVVYTIKNTSTKEYHGYMELVDFVGMEDGNANYEENDLIGEIVSLAPGESKELKMTIYNDDEPFIMHKVSLFEYNDDDLPINLYESNPFSIRPVCDLSFDDISVAPVEDINDEYADFLVKGNQITVSGKINNPEENTFEGSIIMRRYTLDMSEEWEQDEEGNYIIGYDEEYTMEVTIPAHGNIDFSQILDLQGLVKNPDYSVFVEFDLSFKRNQSSDEVPLYSSGVYLLNDGSSTGVNVVRLKGQQAEGIYDLQGRRINGKPVKGIYIIDGKKVILK